MLNDENKKIIVKVWMKEYNVSYISLNRNFVEFKDNSTIATSFGHLNFYGLKLLMLRI